jgi:hypothetical protein
MEGRAAEELHTNLSNFHILERKSIYTYKDCPILDKAVVDLMPLKTRFEESPTSATATIAGRRIALPIRDAPWPLRSMTRAHIKELEYVSLLNG